MSSTLDIVNELQRAANTVFELDPLVRRRLLESGMGEVSSLSQWLVAAGHEDEERPPFLDDMPTLAEMAAKPDAVEVLIAAGMSMLAGEIERLRGIADRLASDGLRAEPTFGKALDDAGFSAFYRGRQVIKQGRGRGVLKLRKHPPDD